MRISIAELREISLRAIRAFGYAEEDSQTILEVLIYAQLRGNNQGVVKLIGPGIPLSQSARPIQIRARRKCAAIIDGGNNHAMVVVNRAVDEVLNLVGEFGVGLVGVNNLNTSSGAIGFYTRRMASAGLIGIVVAGASPVVAPNGAFDPVFGTNPISVALPSKGISPVVLDMATAAMTFFGVIEARTAGRLLPEGIAYDGEGALTRDPAAALKGALRTFDGSYKGSGLSFVVQALTGPLVGASFAGLGDVELNWGGHLVIGIDPDILLGTEALRAGVTAMAGVVKEARRLPGVDETFLPGERGDRRAEDAERSGYLSIGDELYRQLVAAADRE